MSAPLQPTAVCREPTTYLHLLLLLSLPTPPQITPDIHHNCYSFKCCCLKTIPLSLLIARPSRPGRQCTTVAAVQTRHSIYRPGHCPTVAAGATARKTLFLPAALHTATRPDWKGLDLLTKCTWIQYKIRYWLHYRSRSNFRTGL